MNNKFYTATFIVALTFLGTAFSSRDIEASPAAVIAWTSTSIGGIVVHEVVKYINTKKEDGEIAETEETQLADAGAFYNRLYLNELADGALWALATDFEEVSAILDSFLKRVDQSSDVKLTADQTETLVAHLLESEVQSLLLDIANLSGEPDAEEELETALTELNKLFGIFEEK